MPRYLTAPSRFLVIISTFVVALALLLASAVMAAGPEPETVDYRVRSGDSLWTIAREYGTTVDRLRAENRLRNNRILAGQTLKVPVPTTQQ